jgi:hypothetical protein
MCQTGVRERDRGHKNQRGRTISGEAAEVSPISATLTRQGLALTSTAHLTTARARISGAIMETDIRSADRSTIALMRLTLAAANPPTHYGFSPQR